MRKIIQGLVRGEEGASMVEYGLLIALIAIVVAATATTLGTNLSTLYSNAASKI